MARLRKLKALVLIFAFLVLFAGGFTIMSGGSAEAAQCCWVRVCTVNPPFYCWDICMPCPTFP
jgi:hypothetical protein